MLSHATTPKQQTRGEHDTAHNRALHTHARWRARMYHDVQKLLNSKTNTNTSSLSVEQQHEVNMQALKKISTPLDINFISLKYFASILSNLR